MVPGACYGDNHLEELNLWQCYACRGITANAWTMKATATSTYAKEVDALMKTQTDFSGLKRSFVDDIRGRKGGQDEAIVSNTERYPNGYVKVCASWMMRVWADETSGTPDLTKLNGQTSQFDTCGVYNGEDPNSSAFEIIPNKEHPFARKHWSTALDFIEWFGVQKMPEFGIILVDKTEAESENPDNMKCFDSANALKVGITLTAAVLASMM